VITIHIEVLRHDEEEDDDVIRKGSFRQPWPLIKIKAGTSVIWEIKHHHRGDTFRISFPSGSPFGDVALITERSEPQKATQMGTFKYEVVVTDGKTGELYDITHCPILDVDH
jgi:hypothetical protein